MTIEELEIRKFELLQKIQSEELEIKKKELDLKIQEQKSKRIFTPLIVSIVGGLITITTGIVLKYFDSKTNLELEDKKFQSTLLLKATDAKTYNEFSDMLIAFQENGLLSLDSVKIARFRKKRFLTESLNEDINQQQQQLQPSLQIDSSDTETNFYWVIVAGGAANLAGAKSEEDKFLKNGFKNVHIWYRNDSYRTCIGNYSTYAEAINELFEAKEKVNNSSYVVRFDKWCPHSEYDSKNKIYICK